MFARAFLGIPDVDPTPQDNYVAVWSVGIGRPLWKPITGAILSGFAAGLLAFGAAGGAAGTGLTTDATLSYSGGVLAATSLKASSLTSGRVPFAGTGGLLGDSANLTYASATFTIADGTASSSTTTGALVVTGGFAAGGAANIGGNVTQSGGASGAAFIANGNAATNRSFLMQSAGIARWRVYADNVAEAGSDAGSNFQLAAYTDIGSLIDSPISIVRVAGGAISSPRPWTMSGVVSVTNATASSSTTTGALVVTGGVGVGGALNVGGAIGAVAITATETGSGSGNGGIVAATATAGGNAGYRWATGGTNRWLSALIGSAGAEALRWYNLGAGAEAMRLTYGGNLLLGGTTDRGVALQVERLTTLSAGVGDDFSSSIMLAPSYTAAFTVARACYVYCRQPLTAGGAAVTDACVFMFDANAGTHKAVDAGTTKTSPGTVSAWIKVSINGTVHYLPAYVSKTT